MNYSKQSAQPNFYNSNTEKIYASATSGKSESNEWYEFDSEEEAVTFMESNFTSQSFIDNMSIINGTLYHREALIFHDEWTEIIDDSDINDFDSAVRLESRF